MGYYSKVAIAVKEEKFRKWLKERLDNKNTVKFVTEGCETYFGYNYHDEKIRILYWDDVKWYDDDYEDYFPEIQDIKNNLLNKNGHEFLKIGEYYEDYEYENTFEDDSFLYTLREIDIDCSFVESKDEKQINPFLK